MRVLVGLLFAAFGAVSQNSTEADPDTVLAQLSAVRLDAKQIYTIRDVTIRRDVFTIAFNRGTIAFLEPVNGKVTGAVFIGSGEAVAIPPDAVEKQQLYKFTGTPILNETFETAIFRFTDDSYREITDEISRHAHEDVSAEDVAEFQPFDSSLAARSSLLNLRLMADFLEPRARPIFLGELKGDKNGWLNIVFDARAEEEVSLHQIRDIGGIAVANIWASFNQRSEARNPEAAAHEHKSPVDIVAYEIDGMPSQGSVIDVRVTMHMKTREPGARVLNFDFAPWLTLTSVQSGDGEPVKYYQYSNSNDLSVVLPNGLNADQELILQFAYSGELLTRQGYWYPSQLQETIPSISSNIPIPAYQRAPVFEYSGRKVALASYRDQWLIEGLTRYVAAMTAENADPSGSDLRKMLDGMRDELKPVEQAGPIWLGQRLASTISPDGYRAVYAKGVWVIHMLRMMMRENGSNPDSKFLAMLDEFATTFNSGAASTWDFRTIAEKYAGKKLDWFFEQWVFSTGIPAYSLDYTIDTAQNEFTVEGKITQTGVADGFTMPVPIYADGEYLGTVEVGESEEQFKFRSAKRPDRIVIDPEMTILTASGQ